MLRVGQVELGQRDERDEHGAERLDELRVHRGHELALGIAVPLEAHVDRAREEAEDVLRERDRQARIHRLAVLVLQVLGGEELALGPRGHVRAPAEVLRGQVHDAHTRDGRGGGDGEVLDLEDHVHLLVELDALAVCQAERHVVVEHGVHVLDPDGVDGAVEDDPLVVVGLASEGDRAADECGAEPVSPLLRERVELAIELAHRDALGVEDVGPALLRHRGVLVFLLLEIPLRRL